MESIADFVRSLRKWGDVPQFAKFTPGYCCTNRDCRWNIFNSDCTGEEGWFKYMIGFDPDFRASSPRKIDDADWRAYCGDNRHNMVVGGVVVECPECFEKYWFHITLASYEAGKRVCKKWPKETG